MISINQISVERRPNSQKLQVLIVIAGAILTLVLVPPLRRSFDVLNGVVLLLILRSHLLHFILQVLVSLHHWIERKLSVFVHVQNVPSFIIYLIVVALTLTIFILISLLFLHSLIILLVTYLIFSITIPYILITLIVIITMIVSLLIRMMPFSPLILVNGTMFSFLSLNLGIFDLLFQLEIFLHKLQV